MLRIAAEAQAPRPPLFVDPREGPIAGHLLIGQLRVRDLRAHTDWTYNFSQRGEQGWGVQSFHRARGGGRGLELLEQIGHRAGRQPADVLSGATPPLHTDGSASHRILNELPFRRQALHVHLAASACEAVEPKDPTHTWWNRSRSPLHMSNPSHQMTSEMPACICNSWASVSSVANGSATFWYKNSRKASPRRESVATCQRFGAGCAGQTMRLAKRLAKLVAAISLDSFLRTSDLAGVLKRLVSAGGRRLEDAVDAGVAHAVQRAPGTEAHILVEDPP